jgi:SAM-dependent methyltransferase/ribosomal protein S18 acetylase RimI-like enzyme
MHPAPRIEPVDHRPLEMARRLHAVQMAAYAQEAKLLDATWFPPLERTVQEVQASDDVFVAAFIGQELAGAISTGPDPEGLGMTIASLVVLPQFQRQGIASALMEAVLSAHGGGDLTVQTGAKNLPALSLYARTGFFEMRRWLAGREPLELVKLLRPASFRSNGQAVLDSLLAAQDSGRWDSFFQDRARPCPFFVDAPDESLAGWLQEGRLHAGRALELGCGHGRNAVLLAKSGFAVDAVDYSGQALAWARERIAAAGADVSLVHGSVFDLDLPEGGYDLVYDSGCFHHIAPHRRAQYVDLVVRALKPGGRFGLSCFRPEGGSGYPDDEVYRRKSLGGGLGYTQQQLRTIWSAGLEVEVLRPMAQRAAGDGLFGQDFLWVLLARKP